MIANFYATIVGQVIRDDGMSAIRNYTIVAGFPTSAASKGKVICNGIERVMVPARDFASMRWVAEQLGAKYHVYPRCEPYVKAAIEHFSANPIEETVYCHTGFRLIDGLPVYLHAGGAVGASGEAVSGIRTDLAAEGLERYNLEYTGPEVSLQDAARRSLDFLKLGPPGIVYPLWGCAYRAPLAHFLPFKLLLYLYGESGAYKSSLAAVLLAHFGLFRRDEDLVNHFTNTGTILEKKAFILEDSLNIIDDVFPAGSDWKRQELEENFERMIGAYGDHKGRERSNPALETKRAFIPRGVGIALGEYLPAGLAQSRLGRLILLPISKGDIKLAALAQYQAECDVLPIAMRGYIGHIVDNFDNTDEQVGSRFSQLEKEFASPGHSHTRFPDSLAHIYLGIERGIQWCEGIGALSHGEAEEHLSLGRRALLDLAANQSLDIESQKPTAQFLEMLNDALTTRSVCLRHRTNRHVYAGSRNGKMLGWVDEQAVYLLPGPTFQYLNGLRASSKRPQFNEAQTKKQLKAEGILEPGTEENRYDRLVKCERKQERVIKLSLTAVPAAERLQDDTPQDAAFGGDD